MTNARNLQIVDGIAAAWFALCVGASASLAALPLGPVNALLLSLVGTGAGGYAAFKALGAVEWRRPYSLRHFEVAAVELRDDHADELLLDEVWAPSPVGNPVDELILTLEQRLGVDSQQLPAETGELLLEDVLVELQPDSRVIRLFDPAAVPTAGELHSRIERHLNQRSQEHSDAAQALNDALADLRRSLR
jgi:hypothetical protein